MTRIVFSDLSFGFDLPLFEGLSAVLDAGWTGLIGANGAGKTTLLRLIAGDLTPTGGSVRATPAGNIVWCKQQSRDGLEALRRFALDPGKPARRWQGQLGLEPAQLDRFEQLSSGERKRWQLALALASEPDVLLLDEPTNHLDREARELVISALRGFRGTGLLVSHDRALLDALCVRTARVQRRSLEIQPGNYSSAQAEWGAQREATRIARAELRQEATRLAQRADERRRRAESAERERSTARRAKGIHDHDARTLLAKNKAEMAGRRLAREASALGSRLERVQRAADALHVEQELGGELFADYVAWTKPIVLHLAFDALLAGHRRLLGPTALDVARTDKLVLCAPNGSGKTRLITELLLQNPRVAELGVYLPQSLAGNAQRELEARLSGLERGARGRVLSFVAALGTDPDALLRSDAWSPGQTRKLALAFGLAGHAPALILDEPTNHFDLPSIERLERLLCAFPGCVVLVTHDEALAERVGTRFCHIEHESLVERQP
jgi:ATPase subunit of ABC transporter with duplicated ATPase domains